MPRVGYCLCNSLENELFLSPSTVQVNQLAKHSLRTVFPGSCKFRQNTDYALGMKIIFTEVTKTERFIHILSFPSFKPAQLPGFSYTTWVVHRGDGNTIKFHRPHCLSKAPSFFFIFSFFSSASSSFENYQNPKGSLIFTILLIFLSFSLSIVLDVNHALILKLPSSFGKSGYKF